MSSYEGQRFHRKGTFKPYQGFRTPLPETPPSEKPLKSLFGSKRKTERESGKEKHDADARRVGDRSERFDSQDGQTPTKRTDRVPANVSTLGPKSSILLSPGPAHHFGRPDVSMSSDNLSFSLSASNRKFSGGDIWSPLVKGVQSQADIEPDSLSIAMHKLYRFQAENEILRKEAKQWRQAAEDARESNMQLEGVENLLRKELDAKDRREADLQTTVADLRSQLRILQAESDAQKAQLASLADDSQGLQRGAEEAESESEEEEAGGEETLASASDLEVARLQELCSAKAEELLGAEKVMREQQRELRHKEEELQQQSAEIANLNKTIKSLQEYVVTQA